MSNDMRMARLLGTTLEVTVHTKRVNDGRRICSGLDLLTIKGIERALGGNFKVKQATMDIFLRGCRLRFQALAQEVHGANSYAPSIRIQSALAFARQAIGWSGKYMRRQLREAHDWQSLEDH